MSSPQYELEVQVTIRPKYKDHGYTSDRLSVAENLTVSAGDFMETCTILGRFHELAERVKAEQATA